MDKKHLRILRYNIKAGYTVKEEIWTFDSKYSIASSKMVSAYTDKGYYIGGPDLAKMLYKHFGITSFDKAHPHANICSIGFNKEEQRWYGWSHRAIYGFGIGSSVKKGDCGYIPSNREEYIEDTIRWFKDVCEYDNVRVIACEEEGCIKLHYEFTTINNQVIENDYDEPLDIPYGKGEWTAKTIEDAKQMAIDFAISVS